MSDTSTIGDRLVAFINEEVVLDGSTVTHESDLLLSGAVDSLGVIRITQWIEDEVGLVVDPGDVTIENFQTVSRIASYIEATDS